MLASGSLWVFCTGCLSCCLQLTHAHTYRRRVCYSNRFRFLFIYTLSCLPWQLVSTPHTVFLISFPTPFSVSLSLPLSHSHSPSANLLICMYIFFFYYWLHLLCAVVSASSFCVVFVYASFWFSQLKLYLLFLYSLVIPYGQQKQGEQQHQLDLSPYRTESALVYPFLRLFLCSAFSGSVYFVSWVRRRLQVYLCFGLYYAQSVPPTFTPPPPPIALP